MELPATGFIRARQLLGDKNANPPIPPILPISKSTLWEGIKSGRYKLDPVKLGPNCTAFRVEQVRELLATFCTQEAA